MRATAGGIVVAGVLLLLSVGSLSADDTVVAAVVPELVGPVPRPAPFREPKLIRWCQQQQRLVPHGADEEESDCKTHPGRVNDLAARVIGLTGGVLLGRLAAGSQPSGQEQFKPLSFWDGIVTGASAAIWLAPEFLKSPELGQCRWCDFKEQDGHLVDTLNPLDKAVRNHVVWEKHRASAARASDAFLLASITAPLAFIAASSSQESRGRDTALLVESVVLTGALNQIAKHVARRPRPYAHFCDSPCEGGKNVELEQAPNAQYSFFSSHTASAFVLAVSTAEIARRRGYPHAGLIRGTGLALAAGTAYMRIASDRHYFTDALVGAAVGSLVGFAVPYFHRADQRAVGTSIAVSRGGSATAAGTSQAVSVPYWGRTFAAGKRDGAVFLSGGISGGGVSLAFHSAW